MKILQNHIFSRVAIMLATVVFLFGIGNALAGDPSWIVNNEVNAKAAGAAGDGQTDDTTILQQCIDYAKSQKLPLFIPSGTYVVSNTLLVQQVTGLIIRGAGCGKCDGGFPTYNTGTILKYTGSSNGTLFQFEGATRCTLTQMTLDGNNLTGILVNVKSYPSWGGGQCAFTSLSLYYSDIAFQMDDAGYQMLYDNIAVYYCTTGIKSKNNGATLHTVMHFIALFVDTVFDFEQGGNLDAKTVSMYNSLTLLKISNGDVCMGRFMIENCRLDGNSSRTQDTVFVDTWDCSGRTQINLIGISQAGYVKDTSQAVFKIGSNSSVYTINCYFAEEKAIGDVYDLKDSTSKFYVDYELNP